MKFVYLQKQILKNIKNGNSTSVGVRKTREQCLYTFSCDKITDIQLNKKDQKYISNKLYNNKNKFLKVLSRIKKDNNTRQAVMSFSQTYKLPSCIVAIQFLIRDRVLKTLVFSRSLDTKNKLNVDIALVQKYNEKIVNIFKLKNYETTFVVGSAHYYL